MTRILFFIFLSLFCNYSFAYNRYIEGIDTIHDFNVPNCSPNDDLNYCVSSAVNRLIENDFELNKRIIALSKIIQELAQENEKLRNVIYDLDFEIHGIKIDFDQLYNKTPAKKNIKSKKT